MKHFIANDLSTAWAEGFLYLFGCPGGVGETMVTEIAGLDNLVVPEMSAIRTLVDQTLRGTSCLSVSTVASTIFPSSQWNRSANREQLYERYERMWPQIKTHRSGRSSPNMHGVYFRRLTAYQADGKVVNQLEHVIQTWNRGNHRHSALQMNIFDPARDHVHSQQRGFPCLQQIAVTPQGENGRDGLMLTALYPTQYFVEKAYGNYLGLIRLGQFLAHEMNLTFVKLQCIAVKPQLPFKGKWTKGKLARLHAALEGVVGSTGDGASTLSTLSRLNEDHA